MGPNTNLHVFITFKMKIICKSTELVLFLLVKKCFMMLMLLLYNVDEHFLLAFQLSLSTILNCLKEKSQYKCEHYKIILVYLLHWKLLYSPSSLSVLF